MNRFQELRNKLRSISKQPDIHAQAQLRLTAVIDGRVHILTIEDITVSNDGRWVDIDLESTGSEKA